MTVAVRILPEAGLVLVRYAGFATVEATLAALGRAAADPAFARCARHLVDLRHVTGFERDHARFFAMQARIAGHAPVLPAGLLVVYLAPTETAQRMAQMARKSWEGVGDMTIIVAADAEGAASVLGLKGPAALADLLRAGFGE